MTDFRTVPVETGASAVRAWAEQAWPVSRQQALALRDQLGWVGDPADERLFTTSFGLGTTDGGLGFDVDTLADVNFNLSTLAPRGTEDQNAQASWAAYTTYVDAFSALWGNPRTTKHRRITSAQWTLPNGALVSLGGADRLVQVTVLSPHMREATELADE